MLEHESWLSQPEYVVFEVRDEVLAFRHHLDLVKSFQYHLEDLIEDLLLCIEEDTDCIEDNLREYVNALHHDLEAEGWSDEGECLLRAVLNLGRKLNDTISDHHLRTREGSFFYDFADWLEGDFQTAYCFVVAKRRTCARKEILPIMLS